MHLIYEFITYAIVFLFCRIKKSYLHKQKIEITGYLFWKPQDDETILSSFLHVATADLLFVFRCIGQPDAAIHFASQCVLHNPIFLGSQVNVASVNFLFSTLSQGQGECCATTSMWKVELILEFNFLSGSSFLSRLMRQVISVPFVV